MGKDIGGEMRMWLGTGRSFLCYPVSSGRLMNMVAFVPTNLESDESWTAPGDLNILAAEYAGWDDPLLETMGALDQTFRSGIYDRASLPYWSTGRMTLLGDAAHPMVPHLGQGAAQAIEDDFTLAVLLEGAKRQDVPRQLKAYERLRLQRTSQIQTMKVAWVSYASLKDSAYYKLAQKYLPKGAGAVFTFGVKGGFEAGVKLVEGVRLFSHLANIGDTRSLILHPASTTHRQLTDEQRVAPAS